MGDSIFLSCRDANLPAALIAQLQRATSVLDLGSPGARLAKLIGDIPTIHRCRRPGDYLYRAGDDFQFLYVLSTGFAKTIHVSEDGCEHTIGFHLSGDILGLDAVASGACASDAIALEVCEVLAIPYATMIDRCRTSPGLADELHHAFSTALRGDRDQTLRLRGLLAHGRVAAFLLDMSDRFGARGFSATELRLRLTREEIGSLLGLTMETVSRVFSRFAKLGLIRVSLRQIAIIDSDGLLDMLSLPIRSPSEGNNARRDLPVSVRGMRAASALQGVI